MQELTGANGITEEVQMRPMTASVGIITFHAAYNFGSVLQAYALQEAVKKAGYVPKIINYRMKAQKHYYALLRPWYGPRTLAKDVMQAPVIAGRIARRKRFEDFIQRYMRLTDEFDDPNEMPKFANRFDCVISGSDQIWNSHACELENQPFTYMFPYLLCGVTKPKFSYASSIVNMKDPELLRLVPYLRRFRFLSVRERSSCARLQEAVGMNVENVLDPALLFSGDEWRSMMRIGTRQEKSGILFYTLGGYETVEKMKPLLSELADSMKERVTVLTPNCCVMWKKDEPFENHPEFGPIEFLNAIENAKLIVTDSYHGTVLSAALARPFYSVVYGGPSDFRKTDLLDVLGLSGRVIQGGTPLRSLPEGEIDFGPVSQALELLRQNSWNYLEKSIKECVTNDV
jgi:hypothetical protein